MEFIPMDQTLLTECLWNAVNSQVCYGFVAEFIRNLPTERQTQAGLNETVRADAGEWVSPRNICSYGPERTSAGPRTGDLHSPLHLLYVTRSRYRKLCNL
jgi:hypothetical protein